MKKKIFTVWFLCVSGVSVAVDDHTCWLHHSDRFLHGLADLFQAFLSLLMIIPGDIGTLIDFFSFTAWLFYGLTFVAVIVFRFRTKWRHVKRVYKVKDLNEPVNESKSLVFLTPSQPYRLYQGETLIRRVTSQSLCTVPDISQSLYLRRFGQNGVEWTGEAEIIKLEVLAVGKACYGRLYSYSKLRNEISQSQRPHSISVRASQYFKNISHIKLFPSLSCEVNVCLPAYMPKMCTLLGPVLVLTSCIRVLAFLVGQPIRAWPCSRVLADVWIDGWMIWWMDGLMNGWQDWRKGWFDVWMSRWRTVWWMNG